MCKRPRNQKFRAINCLKTFWQKGFAMDYVVSACASAIHCYDLDKLKRHVLRLDEGSWAPIKGRMLSCALQRGYEEIIKWLIFEAKCDMKTVDTDFSNEWNLSALKLLLETCVAERRGVEDIMKRILYVDRTEMLFQRVQHAEMIRMLVHVVPCTVPLECIQSKFCHIFQDARDRRKACLDAIVLFLAGRRFQKSPLLACVPMDVMRLIAKDVWKTRRAFYDGKFHDFDMWSGTSSKRLKVN